MQEETKPVTFGGVFDMAVQAVETMGDPCKARELEEMWAEVEESKTLERLREFAAADEYYPGRFCLQIGGDHEGEAWTKDDGGYRVILHGDKPRHVDTIEEAKELMVQTVHQREVGQ